MIWKHWVLPENSTCFFQVVTPI